MKVFLGGTCNESTWRNRIIPMLAIDYFNPVVDDWNEEEHRFSDAQWKSLMAVAGMINRNGGHVFYNLNHAAAWMNAAK